MYSTLVTLALLAAPALAQLSISTPKLTQCKDVEITWSNGKGPYNLIVVKEEDPCGDALADLGDHDGTKLNYKVALAAGQKVQLSLEDSTGEEAWSGIITVEGSDDKSCLTNKAIVQPNGPGENKPAAGSNSNGPVAVAGSGSTVVVTPIKTVDVTASTPTVASGSSSGNSGLSGAVGGVGNAGANPLGLGNGALTMRQASTPVMVLGAFAAILVASL